MSGFGRVARRFVSILVLTAVIAGLSAASAGAAGQFVIEPEDIDFGIQVPDRDTDRSLVIRNLGPGDARLNDIYMFGDVDPFDFLFDDCPLGATMSAGSGCSVTLRFAPFESGDFEAMLVVEGEPEDEPAVAALTGRSRNVGQLVPSPAVVDFGAVRSGASSPPKVVQIHNDGGFPIDIDTIYANGATIVSSSCGREIAPLATCEMTLTFKPYAGVFTSDQAAQSAELRILALVWDKMPPRRLQVQVPLRATAVTSSGALYPSRTKFAGRIRHDLGRLAQETIRFAGNRTDVPSTLSELRAFPFGLFDLTLRARVGKRWTLVARASAQVDGPIGPELRWTKQRRKLLRAVKPVQLKAVARFRSYDRTVAIAETVTRRAKLQPAVGKRKRS